MSRRIAPLVAVILSACAASDPPPPVAPVIPIPPLPMPVAPPPQPSPRLSVDPLTGKLGGRPFTARSALLVQPNSLTTRCLNDGSNARRCEEDLPVSYIRVLERDASCADLVGPGERPDIRQGPNERLIEIVLQARWPVPSGTTLGTDATMSMPRRDHVTSSFKDSFASGAIAKGSARFTTNGPGTALTVDLETTNPNLPTSGRVTGTIDLVFCPLDAPRSPRR